MGKKQDGVQETSAQQEMASMAMKRLQDYKTRWLPLQKQVAAHVSSMGEPDSFERRQAAGKASTETAAKFSQARKGVEESTTDAGVGLNSGRMKLGITGMADDEAASRGLGITASDSAIDDAYTSGLGALAAIGQGKAASAMNGTAAAARMSAQTAANDAEMSAADRAGNAQLIGQGLGLAAGGFGGRGAGGSQMTVDPTGYGIVAGNSPDSATSAQIMGRR